MLPALEVVEKGAAPAIYGLRTASDFNGDGFADIYFQRSDDVARSGGAADENLLGGNPHSLGVQNEVITPRSDGGRVSGVCDLDLDGYFHVLRDLTMTGAGKLQAVHGGPAKLRESFLKIDPGYGLLSRAANLTGSGRPALLLSSNDVPPLGGGRFRVVDSAGCDNDLPQASGGVGMTDVARAVGDVDGDGYADVIIGDAYADHATRNRAVLFFGGCAGERSVELPGGISRAMSTSGVLSVVSFPSAGYAVAGTGDVDGDGFSDLAVGNPYRTGEGFGAGMGVLPCELPGGVTSQTLGLDGSERFEATLEGPLEPRQSAILGIERRDGRRESVRLTVRIDTPIEVAHFEAGGILPYVLEQLLAGEASAGSCP